MWLLFADIMTRQKLKWLLSLSGQRKMMNLKLCAIIPVADRKLYPFPSFVITLRLK